MDESTRKLVQRAEIACRRMANRLDNYNRAAIAEIELLTSQLASARAQIKDQENQIKALKEDSRRLHSESKKLKQLQSRRMAEVNELENILSDLKPLLKEETDA